MIAWVIIYCERKTLGHSLNPNRIDPNVASGQNLSVRVNKDDWCRFVVHQLAMNCIDSNDLMQNKVWNDLYRAFLDDPKSKELLTKYS